MCNYTADWTICATIQQGDHMCNYMCNYTAGGLYVQLYSRGTICATIRQRGLYVQLYSRRTICATIQQRDYMCNYTAEGLYVKPYSRGTICATMQQRDYMCNYAAERLYVQLYSRGTICATIQQRDYMCNYTAEGTICATIQQGDYMCNYAAGGLYLQLCSRWTIYGHEGFLLLDPYRQNFLEIHTFSMEKEPLRVSLPVFWAKSSHCSSSKDQHSSNNFERHSVTGGNDTGIANEQRYCDFFNSFLPNLGFIINQKKSVFAPVQEIEFLGVMINSIHMTLFLPQEGIFTRKCL